MSPPNTAPIEFPSDPRVEHRYANLNGIRYHYLFAEPKNAKPKVTVFLIHGWPDISAGWRYQIPALLALQCRVVVPDMMGYGGTEAPKVPPNPIQLYGMKRAADDLAELARQLDVKTIVLGGHDWGGMVVWRTILWHPELVSHVFSVCTPFESPSKTYRSTEDLVNGPAPQFGYQIHLASGEVERKVQSREELRRFLSGMYGGRGPNREVTFAPNKGIIFENLPIVGPSRLIKKEELDYYVDEYARHGLHPTLNWYRTRRANWEDDQKLEKRQIEIPALFIQATKDTVLKPEMSAGMNRNFSNLTRREVQAAHWALWEASAEVNQHLEDWLTEQVFELKSTL